MIPNLSSAFFIRIKQFLQGRAYPITPVLLERHDAISTTIFLFFRGIRVPFNSTSFLKASSAACSAWIEVIPCPLTRKFIPLAIFPSSDRSLGWNNRSEMLVISWLVILVQNVVNNVVNLVHCNRVHILLYI